MIFKASLSLMLKGRVRRCTFGAAEFMQGKDGKGGAGPQENEDLVALIPSAGLTYRARNEASREGP